MLAILKQYTAAREDIVQHLTEVKHRNEIIVVLMQNITRKIVNETAKGEKDWGKSEQFE
jgi:hypothetical protein